MRRFLILIAIATMLAMAWPLTAAAGGSGAASQFSVRHASQIVLADSPAFRNKFGG